MVHHFVQHAADANFLVIERVEHNVMLNVLRPVSSTYRPAVLATLGCSANLLDPCFEQLEISVCLLLTPLVQRVQPDLDEVFFCSAIVDELSSDLQASALRVRGIRA